MPSLYIDMLIDRRSSGMRSTGMRSPDILQYEIASSSKSLNRHGDSDDLSRIICAKHAATTKEKGTISAITDEDHQDEYDDELH